MMPQAKMLCSMGEKEIRIQLRELAGKKLSDQALVQRSIDLARAMGPLVLGRLHAEERAFLSALSRLVTDAPSRRFAEEFCERVLREGEQPAELLRRLLAESGGVPTFFSSMGRLRIKAAMMATRHAQQAVPAEVQRVFRATFGEHLLPLQPARLNRRAEAMSKEGVRLLFQPLFPHVFGEDGACEYTEVLEKLLTEQPHAGVAVQPWRLCPELSPCSPGLGARTLAGHLRQLIIAAVGRPLVVETYCSDTLAIIVEALKLALDSPECDGADVALMLPGYLRSSISILRELTDWARPRAERGALPLKVLLVKGNHLDAERRCSALYGTEAQLCATKAETDTCYTRLLNAAMNCPARVITPVVGTHELLHLCYAALRWVSSGREGLPPVCFSYGLGNHLARQFARLGAPALLCAPVAPDDPDALTPEMLLMQLVRELSRPEGFLMAGYAADATGGGEALSEKARPLMAANNVSEEPARAASGGRMGNLGSLLDRAYIDAFYQAAEVEKERSQEPLPLCPGGQAYSSPLTFIHRSLTVPGLPDYRFASADYAAVDLVLKQACARSSAPLPQEEERAAALLKASRELRRRSTEFAALLVRDAGLTLRDAQLELRDAIDALRYYADDSLRAGFRDGTSPRPLGVVVVAVGVAHPLAEAAAGIAAAWIGGNSIIYKPAAYSTLVGTRLSALLEAAGVRLLCLPCVDNEISARLMSDPRVDALICTGSPELVQGVLAKAPAMAPFVAPAEPPSIYISQHADWEAALRDIVPAVFRRSGQSPTCPHTVMVHARLYDDPAFVAALGDAVSSLCTRPTWLEGADLGPLSAPLSEEARLLMEASQKEGSPWPLPVRAEEPGSLLLQPGLCLEAAPGSAYARVGRQLPALGLIRVESVDDAMELQLQMSRRSACVLYSRSAEEVELWKRALAACPCLAVNCCPAPRPGMVPAPLLTGSRQSARAPMMGGSNFASALCSWQETGRPAMRSTRRHLVFDPKGVLPSSGSSGVEDAMRLSAAADSVSYWWEKEFGTPQELPSAPGLRVQLSYHPLALCLRVEKAMTDANLAIALMAAMQAGCSLRLSLAEQRSWLTLFAEQYGVPLVVEERAEYEASFPALASAGLTLRDPAAMEESLCRAAACHLPIITEPVLANARLELLHCLEERLLISAEA